MGEYVKLGGKTVKLGTCEDLYYCTFQAFKKNAWNMTRLSGNDTVSGYMKPETYRFRFPFPDEDEAPIGSHPNYSRGAIVPLPVGTFDADHSHLWHSANVGGGCYNVNISIPCPASVSPYPLEHSPFPPELPWEIIQQKLMANGELWTVIRCGYCKSAIRLDKDSAATLTEAIKRNYLVKSNGELKTPQDDAAVTFWAEISRRIMSGYEAGE